MPIFEPGEPRQMRLGRARMLRFLGEFLSSPDVSYRTLYISREKIPDVIRLREYIQGPVPENLGRLIGSSGTGAVLFWGTKRCLVLPPFPVDIDISSERTEAGPLVSMLSRDYLIALILIRLGHYALGVVKGEKLITADAGTGLVHSRHRQGGSSAHRFERHRDKQIEYFLTRVCAHARQVLEPHLGNIDYAVYGGARTTIEMLRKDCPFLNRLDDRTLPPLLTIPDPRRATLDSALTEVWSSRVYIWN